LEWCNYTPYEIRILGAFVYLGQKRRAHELLDFFMSDRRPPQWNQWAEVVWHEGEPARFIGDMPHTWVGSDYIRAIRSMFAYERESDSALVIGAGIPEVWLADSESVGVEKLPTYYGPLTFRMRRTPRGASVEVSGGIDLPPGGVEVRAPLDQPPRAVLADGVEAVLERGAGVKVRTLPTRIDFLR
jgi:hypothetical protein